MKKLSGIISTLILTVAFAVSAFAATGKISFSDPSATSGDEVNVTMKVASEDGTLARADVTVAYDANLLEFISGTDADGGAGTVRVHGATNGAGTGTLEYNLRFRTLAAGTATITIGTQEVYDTDEQMVDIQHEGTSTITINAPASASTNAALAALSVSPGELSPAFGAEVSAFEVTVGTDVDVLAVNASAADSGATIAISGNEGLQMGENTVTITVTAADGTTQNTYDIKVIKQEGGATLADAATSEAETEAPSETVNEGVKLSAKEKTITIMSPGSDVEIPAGFAESTIDIDGHQVKGWVWKADTEHKYCIVYGMNDAGELNFYRYDLSEKTLQRYFEDPIAADLTENAASYPALVEEYDKLVQSYNTLFLIMCLLGIAALVLLVLMVVVLRRSRSERSKKKFTTTTTSPTEAQPQTAPKRTSRRKGGAAQPAADETIDIKAVMAHPDISKDEEDLGVTQVIKRPGRKAAQATDETVVLSELKGAEKLNRDADAADVSDDAQNAAELDIEDLS